MLGCYNSIVYDQVNFLQRGQIYQEFILIFFFRLVEGRSVDGERCLLLFRLPFLTAFSSPLPSPCNVAFPNISLLANFGWLCKMAFTMSMLSAAMGWGAVSSSHITLKFGTTSMPCTSGSRMTSTHRLSLGSAGQEAMTRIRLYSPASRRLFGNPLRSESVF